MDPQQFDALARTLHGVRTRRVALRSLLGLAGAVALGRTEAEAKRRAGKGKRRRRGGSRCVACNDRPLGTSADLKGCDLRGRNLDGAQLVKSDLAGACLQDASLVAAELRSADLEGADLSGADLTDADLRNADINGWQTAGATFCRTIMPGGELNNIDCPPGSGAGGGRCTTTADCAAQRCQSVSCRSGLCQYNPLDDGTVCEAGSRVCRTGQCIPNECVLDRDCPVRSCQAATCPNHLCVYTRVANGGNGGNCDGSNQCWDGRCLTPPTCRGKGEAVAQNQCGECCSHNCFGIGNELACDMGVAGRPCHVDRDCYGNCGNCFGFCRAFVCFER
jgi:hypothetical protein